MLNSLFSKNSDSNFENHYKLKSLNTFTSLDTLIHDTKRYRRVFERKDTDYIYCEFAFYNKQFDKRDWKAKVTFIAYSLQRDSRKELCKIENTINISKEENIVKMREGWGDKEKGLFWLMGDYEWAVYVNDQWIDKITFYVEDLASSNEDFNPYFKIKNIALYEGPDEGLNPEQRKYTIKFDSKNTRFIWIDISLTNCHPSAWYCELLINFYSECGYHKGQVSELKYFSERTHDFSIQTGWGSKEGNTWFPGKYRAEVIFKEQLIQVIHFEVE